MRRDKVKILIIITVICTFIALLFFFGLKVYNSSFKSFKLNGYIIANKSNYIPLWFETFGDVFDDGFVYKDLIRQVK